MDDKHRSIVRRAPLPGSASTPLVTPIMPSVVYGTQDADALDAIYEGRVAGFSYAREGHPNAEGLARRIDWLEGRPENAAPGILTGSGMAALSAIFLGLLKAGDHILAGDQLYGRSLRLLSDDLPRLGFRASFVDAGNAASVEAAITDATRMIVVEVASNPTLRLADIKAIAAMARQRGLLLAVDNTFTTPRAFQPFDHGADIVFHSLTKMLAGHSDATLGYVAAADPTNETMIRDAAITWGLTPSPFDCWLTDRGLHTFHLRFDKSQENAAKLARHLAGLDGVEKVIYPGRDDHPDRELAKDLLGDNPGNMVSFRITGGRTAANRLIRSAPHIAFAPTLGDVGTTLSHPASSSHRGLAEAAREKLGINEGFFRVSVGIEDCDQLCRELSDAITSATG